MTISIGLIPNENTVMLIQDSEATYPGVGFTQDIYTKIRDIDNSAVTGIIGNPLVANEIMEKIRGRNFSSGRDLSESVEEAYSEIRLEHLRKGVLSKYEFEDLREILAPPSEVHIDPSVREEILAFANNRNGFFSLDLMLASNYNKPRLCTVSFPGVGIIHNNVKDYTVSGSGSIMALDRMGEELKNYRWEKELTVDQGIDVLMKAGTASEKHIGVGGPFEIVFVQKRKEGNKVFRPDRKKLNMVMYLQPLGIDEDIMMEAIGKMRNPKVKPNDLAEHIKSKTGVGIEFDRYIGFNRK